MARFGPSNPHHLPHLSAVVSSRSRRLTTPHSASVSFLYPEAALGGRIPRIDAVGTLILTGFGRRLKNNDRPLFHRDAANHRGNEHRRIGLALARRGSDDISRNHSDGKGYAASALF